MQTGILASPSRRAAWESLAGNNTTCSWAQDTLSAQNYDIFIDLDFDQNSENIRQYAGNTKTIFLLSAVNQTPEMAFLQAGLKYGGEKIFGINAIPTFLERKTLEISNPFGLEPSLLTGLDFWENMEWVESRVGMVTPRIVFMIINEAFYTLQEGTASQNDIDNAMKLGTNYPKGPFEWCKAAGIENVYQTLLRLLEDTGDERYRICPALKQAWIKSQI